MKTLEPDFLNLKATGSGRMDVSPSQPEHAPALKAVLWIRDSSMPLGGFDSPNSIKLRRPIRYRGQAFLILWSRRDLYSLQNSLIFSILYGLDSVLTELLTAFNYLGIAANAIYEYTKKHFTQAV